MKTTIAATLLVLLVTTAASAQQSAADKAAAQYHRASIKIWTGLGLIGGGAFVLPITAANARRPPDGPALGVGLGCMAFGGYLVWWGASEGRHAVQPQTTFGVVLGRNTGVQIRRTW